MKTKITRIAVYYYEYVPCSITIEGDRETIAKIADFVASLNLEILKEETEVQK